MIECVAKTISNEYLQASDGTAVKPPTIAPETIGMQHKDRVLAELGMINRLAARRFTSPTLAEEAVLYVLDALEQDDWQRVRGHTGPGSFATYLASLSWRLLEDFARRRFGRKRPPRWIRALGGIHALLFRLLCLERLDLNAAVELVAQRQEFPDRGEIETAAWAVLDRIIDCRAHQALEVDIAEADDCRQGSTPFDRFEDDDRDCFLEAIFAGVFDRSVGERRARTHAALRRLRLELDTEERLLLQMCYQDNLSVTRAGELLGLNRHQVHGRLRRLLARLRQALEKAGFAAELRELLD